MPVNKVAYQNLVAELRPKKITLVAVSKTKSIQEIRELYDLGQRDFGENYVQELAEKVNALPGDIRWHFIGHLQTNKVKQLIPFIHLIQSVDSVKLLKEISKQSEKIKRATSCLLQIHISQEETKFGLNDEELGDLLTALASSPEDFGWISIHGVMGMATLTDDMEKVRREFAKLRSVYETLHAHNIRPQTLSMGMTADYKIAIEEGSNLIRLGSLLFGERS